MDEMGMSDLQYKDHLRGLINDLKRVKEAGVSEKAAAEIDQLIERFEKTLED